jgi:hypothetical protein
MMTDARMMSIELKAPLASSILRVLRALRGEFFLTSGLASQPASVPCEPKLDVTTHSKRQGTREISPP